MRKYITLLFFLQTALFAKKIWRELEITKEHYYYLSGFSGLIWGGIFGATIIYLVVSWKKY